MTMRYEPDETEGLLTRLFGAGFDDGAWRVEVANENETLLRDLIDDDDVDSIVVMVYGKKKKTRR